MPGIIVLVLIGVCALLCAAHKESRDITDNTPTAPPAKDAYDV